MQFDFRRGGKKCSQCQTAFEPGQEYVSALIELDDGQTARLDLCEQHWQESDDQYIGHWNQTMPDLTTGTVYWAPRDVLMAYFEHLVEGDNKETVYVMSLLLLRKRFLTAKSRFENEDGSGQIVTNRSSGQAWEVYDVDVTPQRIVEIQDELSQNLFSTQRSD